MTNTEQTREQLIEEVAALRTRVAELEGLVSEEFVSNLSIELRRAFTTLKLYEHLLRERGDQDPEKRDKYHAAIRREIWWLEYAVEKLLYWLLLQTGWEPQARLEELDLNSIVGSIVANTQMRAKRRGGELTIAFTEQPDLPPAHGNGELLSNRVLCMILTNAVMFTPEGGEVAVMTGTQDADNQQWVGFTIRDTGPGISPEELPHIFEPYFLGEAGRYRHYSGSGLGLAIAKQTVDWLQGRIELTSSGIPGEGTTVSVWLPVADPDAGSEKPTT